MSGFESSSKQRDSKGKGRYGGQQRRQGPRLVEIPEEPTQEQYDKLISRGQYTVTWHLERGDKTRQQITQKLVAKGFTQDYIDPILDWAKDVGYLDDERFARNFSESRLKRHGASRVKRDMIMKGIDRELADTVLRELTDEDQTLAVATELARKQLRRSNNQPTLNEDGVSQGIDQKARQRILSSLARSGYSFAVGAQALKEALESEDDDINDGIEYNEDSEYDYGDQVSS